MIFKICVYLVESESNFLFQYQRWNGGYISFVHLNGSQAVYVKVMDKRYVNQTKLSVRTCSFFFSNKNALVLDGNIILSHEKRIYSLSNYCPCNDCCLVILMTVNRITMVSFMVPFLCFQNHFEISIIILVVKFQHTCNGMLLIFSFWFCG